MIILHRIAVLLSAVAASVVAAADYGEQLDIRPLPGPNVLASFNFRANTTADEFAHHDFRFFPRSLGQIIEYTGTTELHLRFSTGRWDSLAWGARPWGGAKEGGTGVELWAWLDAGDARNEVQGSLSQRWSALTNLLSGFFCASINFVDQTRTVEPVWAFSLQGRLSPKKRSNLALFHGMLPHEVVCTENLTPLLKLLPCKGHAGIASLVDGHRLFDASWQTMSLDVRPICDRSGSCVIQFEATLDMVLNTDRARESADSRVPLAGRTVELECDTSKAYHGPDTCFPLEPTDEREIMLSTLFGRPIRSPCQPEPEVGLAVDQVCVVSAPDRPMTVHYGDQSPPVPVDSVDGHARRCVPVANDSFTDVRLAAHPINSSVPVRQADVTATRDIVGYGAERGDVETVIHNRGSSTVSIVLFESLPWFMRPYMSTLSARLFTGPSSQPQPHPFIDRHFRLGKDRVRGAHIELIIEIPPSSSVAVSYRFDKALLRYAEYPPDASRGFDVPPAVIRLLGEKDDQEEEYIRTTSLLLTLPTPDFSMPYNVIILTSTVIALGFGSIFNMLSRRPVFSSSVPKKGQVFRDRLKGRIAALRRLFSRKHDKTD